MRGEIHIIKAVLLQRERESLKAPYQKRSFKKKKKRKEKEKRIPQTMGRVFALNATPKAMQPQHIP